MARYRDSVPTILLIAAMAVSAAVLLYFTSKLTFLLDDWDFLLHRRGVSPGVFLDPHNEHISVAPVLVYKAIQAGIGMESLLPYAVASTAVFLTGVALLFTYLQRRVGGWLALAAVAPILFFGSAAEDLLTPFQIGYFGSVACGIGMLLAFDREDDRGDLLACVLLVGSLTFSSLGLPFLAGAAVQTAIGRDRRRRAYVVLVPAALYAIWWLGWGHTAKNDFTFGNLATSPSYVLDGFASSLSSLLGLASPRDEMAVVSVDWGRPLLVGALVIVAVRLRRLGRVPDRLWVVAVIAIAFWFLAGLSATQDFRAPTVSRYQFVGAVLILLIAAELARGLRPGTRVVVIALALAGAATLSNFDYLHGAYVNQKYASAVVRGDLAGLDITADRVLPGFYLNPRNSNFQYFREIDAGSYISATEKFGSPAYDTQELLSAPQPARLAADMVTAAALGIRLYRGVAPPRSASCRVVDALPAGTPAAELGPGAYFLRNRSPQSADIHLARYSDAVSVGLGQMRPGVEAALRIPADRSQQLWRLVLQNAGPGPGRFSLCSAGT